MTSNYLSCNLSAYEISIQQNATRSTPDGCDNLYQLEYSSFSLSMYGIVSPIIILLTVLTNCLVCAVLCRENMRNPTNDLLLAMAVSDTLTGLSPLPCFLYFYSFGSPSTNLQYMPYSWCALYFSLVDYLPTIFHTASVWLTVALAVQRYVCVCMPWGAGKTCGPRGVRIIIASIYCTAIISQFSRFFELKTIPVEAKRYNREIENNQTTTAILPYNTIQNLEDDAILLCRVEKSDLVAQYTDIYFSIYYWFRIVFIHLAPCLFLIIMNALLVETIRQTQARRRLLLLHNRRQESRRAAESTQRTRMLIVVVGIFIVVELPLAVMLIITVLENTLRQQLTDPTKNRLATLLLNFFVLLSYPINFFIYCAMSTQFRETFSSIFFCQSRTRGPLLTRQTDATTTEAFELSVGTRRKSARSQSIKCNNSANIVTSAVIKNSNCATSLVHDNFANALVECKQTKDISSKILECKPI